MWLSASQSYPCDSRAGTELFAHRFNRSIQPTCEVSALFYGPGPARSGVYDGVTWHSVTQSPVPLSRMDTWNLVPRNLTDVRKLFSELKPSVVHFHGLSSSLSPDHIRAARDVGAKTIMTYHAPGQSCQRWDLLQDNRNVCTGKIDIKKCTDCALQRLGVPSPISRVFRSLDLHQLGSIMPGPLGHVLERRRGTEAFQSRWAEAITRLDFITYHSKWVRELLLSNDVPEEKLISLPLPPPPNPSPVEPAEPDLWAHARPSDSRVLYVGRLIDIKGVQVLVEAFTNHLENTNVRLLLIGAPGPADFERRIRSLIQADGRILLVPSQEESAVRAAMMCADVVVVPSLWPETGPYTVTEALYLGKKVIGANRGGIAERLRGVKGGFLYDPYDASELSLLLSRVLRNEPDNRKVFSPKGYEADYNTALSALMHSVGLAPHCQVAATEWQS